MISVEDIMAVVRDQESKMDELLREEKIIVRELAINPRAISYGAANIITGPRRSGKSILAYQLARKEGFGYVNFDDERLTLDASELNKILEAIYSLKGNVKLIILDEIQEVSGWERFCSRLVGSTKLLITGSNARMMSKELSTYMTGRHIDHELLPFSFREFLDYKGFKRNGKGIYTTEEKSRIMTLLKDYLDSGGFPIAVKSGTKYLADLYRDLIQRDVVQRHKIKMTSKLSDVARYLVSNSSSEITYNKLRKTFEISSKHTIQDWISYMKQAYLLFEIERFSFKLKEAIMAPKKIYSIDTGFVTSLSFERNTGRLMETAVAIELKRRNNYLWKGRRQINYWKNHNQKEADFVIREDNKIAEIIQVTYASKETDIKEREIENLIAASKELKCNNLLVITWDYEKKIKSNGRLVKYVPLCKWLLNYGAE